MKKLTLILATLVAGAVFGSDMASAQEKEKVVTVTISNSSPMYVGVWMSMLLLSFTLAQKSFPESMSSSVHYTEVMITCHGMHILQVIIGQSFLITLQNTHSATRQKLRGSNILHGILDMEHTTIGLSLIS